MDRENVIRNIREEIENAKFQKTHYAHVSIDVLSDACELLKEQEAVKPKKVKGYNPPLYTIYEYECEKCKSPMMNKQPFCMGCGRQVKWE